MDTGDDDFTGSRMLAAQVTQPGQQGKHVGYARTTNCHSLNSEGKSSGAGPSSASKRQSDAAVPDLTLPHHPCTRSSAKVTHILRNMVQTLYSQRAHAVGNICKAHGT